MHDRILLFCITSEDFMDVQVGAREASSRCPTSGGGSHTAEGASWEGRGSPSPEWRLESCTAEAVPAIAVHERFVWRLRQLDQPADECRSQGYVSRQQRVQREGEAGAREGRSSL